MDVYEEDQAIHKQSADDRARLPLVSTENKNGVTRSRYRSSSPTKHWTPSTSTHATSAKRAISAERNRPSRPSSPRSPSTPIQDTSAGLLLAPRKVAGNKMPEALWPSTTRSPNVSLQPDTFFSPVRKKEKPVSYIPERKQTPLEGKSSAYQSENSKPVDSLYPRMVDQHRWPSTTAGKVYTSNDMFDKQSLDKITVSSKSIELANKTIEASPSSRSETGTVILTRGVDVADKTSKTSSLFRPETGSPSLERLSLDGTSDHNRSIDVADKTSSPSSLSSYGTGTPSHRRLSQDVSAVLNRGIEYQDKKNKTSLSPTLGRGTSTHSIRRIPLDGSHVPNQSINLVGRSRTTKTLSSTCTETGTPSPKIVSLDEKSELMVKSTNDLLVSCDENGRALVNECSVDDCSTPIARSDSASSSDRTQMSNSAMKHMAAPALGLLSTVSKWIIPTRGKAVNSSGGSSPARKRPSSPARKRPSSPSWIRPSSPTRKLPSAASVFSFLTDIKHGKKAKHIEDVHNLRLLYNRLLQWRYANARSDDALHSQKVKTEKVLSSVWMEIVAVWDSIIEKKIEIQQLKLKLKLYTILDNQICGLEEWKSTEMDHISSLSWAIEDLQAGTVLVPVIRGARGSIQKIKEAVSLAVDVMQAMGSSLRSVLLKVNRMHSLASDLADVVTEGRAIFDEYESLLIFITELQVEESSLRSHLLQMKQARSNVETSIYGY
ncbi:QWRF motif-containing protein 4-like [Salvia hispanica]|uniref:QWRF motif-containing protein 4-like n=1 Tax=Salvia hispanica TaxID=49212 RepID=UPI002009214E|nr:QWRF motif-containing protein 4-like [Salvia hispanica]